MKLSMKLINKSCFVLVKLCLLLCMSTQGFAQENKNTGWIEKKPMSNFWVNPGFYSYHFDRDLNLSDENPGFGLEYQYSTTQSLTAGMYRNSYRDTSHYVGWYWQPLRVGPFKLGAVIGGFRGYSNYKDGDWFPALIPVLTYEYKRVALNVSLIPSYQDRIHGALSFQLKFKLND